jgi:hypothetical protein
LSNGQIEWYLGSLEEFEVIQKKILEDRKTRRSQINLSTAQQADLVTAVDAAESAAESAIPA